MIPYEWIVSGLLGLCWGIAWAATLQWTAWGQWAARRRTWLTVVIGTGGTLACALVAVDWLTVLGILWLFSLSSVGVIARAFLQEWREDQ